MTQFVQTTFSRFSRRSIRSSLLKAAFFAALAAVPVSAQAQGTGAICYNCPPTVSDWGTALSTIKDKLGITVPPDNRNSGQALSQIIVEKANPVADVIYYGIPQAVQAKREGVVAPYKPAHWDQIPAALKDPDGYWFAVHSSTIGFMVNLDALGKKPVPKSWADLLDPQYSGMVGILDPSSALIGYSASVAINQARGGSFKDWGPAIAFYKALQKNQPIFPKQAPYARVLSGEIPIGVLPDNDAYRAKYRDKANIQFVIPAEGTILVPWVMSLVKGAPHPDNAKKILDFVVGDDGQKVWANAYQAVVRSSAAQPEIDKLRLPPADYERVKTVDYQAMAESQAAFIDLFVKEIN